MTVQEVLSRFFCYRNGEVAKTYKNAGVPYTRIFGLQLPQIAEIAREIGYDPELAAQLWEMKECREARLLACYLFDPSTLLEAEALALAASVRTREETDILCWRLLRRLPYAHTLLTTLESRSASPNLDTPHFDPYIAEALRRNLAP